MEEQDIKQYEEIFGIIQKYKASNPQESDIKVIFNSYEGKNDKSFASFQFPVENYNEEMFLRLKEYAKVDYELAKRKNLPVGRTTKFNFAEPVRGTVLYTYDYNHDIAFLEEMIDIQIKK